MALVHFRPSGFQLKPHLVTNYTGFAWLVERPDKTQTGRTGGLLQLPPRLARGFLSHARRRHRYYRRAASAHGYHELLFG